MKYRTTNKKLINADIYLYMAIMSIDFLNKYFKIYLSC